MTTTSPPDPRERELPSPSAPQTKTFMAWDLEGSTRAWEERPDLAQRSVAAWVDAAHRAVTEHGGALFKLVGDGGWAVFDSATSAVSAAVDIHRSVDGDVLAARTAVYSGEAERQPDGDWLGTPLNRCARLLGLGHGGQLLIAGSTATIAEPAGWALRDLGVHPLRDVATPIVVYQVLADGLAESFRPLRSDVRRVLLPAVRDRLIGRDDAVELVCDLLATHRLVTLAGVGGTGKTRVAIEAARVASADHATTAFVDLAALAHGSQVPAAVLGALDIAVQDRAASPELLVEVLGDRTALLLLDNAEHLLDDVADAVEAILDGCPHVRLLVTSREPLGVGGERVWRVPSLDAGTAAVELLRERAGADVDHAAAIELCTHLDGIPLAIELAAARVRSLGIDHVLDHLEDRFRLLVGGRRARGRQATLQAALDWSHQLLAPAEQQLLRRLAVFAGGFTVAAAEQVCGPLDDVAVPDALAALVDKSLVDRHGERLRLLETVRTFAHERLAEAGEVHTTRDGLVDWMRSELVARPYNDLTTLLPLVPEASNLRAAFDWLEVTGRDRELLDLINRSAGIWIFEMLEAEVDPQLQRAYERCGSALTACEHVDVLGLLAFLGHDPVERVAEASAIDPDGRCPGTQHIRRRRAYILSITDPAAALAELEALRRDHHHLSPEADLTLVITEAHARFNLGDPDGAEAVLSVVPGHPSIFWHGPVCALASLRILRGDLDGAEAAIRLAESAEHAPVRMGAVSFDARWAQLHAARGEMTDAFAALRRVEAVRDERLALYPAADHQWLESAGFVAAELGRIGDAAVLSDRASALHVMETSLFVPIALRARYASRPDWQAALATGPTLDDARSIARAIARLG